MPRSKSKSVDKQLKELESSRESVAYEQHPARHGIIYSCAARRRRRRARNAALTAVCADVTRDFSQSGNCTNVIFALLCCILLIGIVVGVVFLSGCGRRVSHNAERCQRIIAQRLMRVAARRARARPSRQQARDADRD